jgi:hypothetical protein
MSQPDWPPWPVWRWPRRTNQEILVEALDAYLGRE